jgi:hypothetical protein
MDNLVDHFISGLALIIATVVAWLSRRGIRVTRRGQKLADIIPKAVDAALRHQKQGANHSIDLRITAAQFAKHLDLEDGKQDFSSEKIHAEVVAELHRRGL